MLKGTTRMMRKGQLRWGAKRNPDGEEGTTQMSEKE
jgi:hypothetical protein